MTQPLTNRISYWRKARGLTQQNVADQLGIDLSNYNKLERGKRDLTLKRLAELGRILNVAPVSLITDVPPLRPIPVVGTFASGVWKSAFHWEDERCYNVSIPNDQDSSNKMLYGGEIGDDSMDRVYAPGTVIIVESYDHSGPEFIVGKRYHCEVRRNDGMVENSVKTLKQSPDGRFWLAPESNNPAYVPLEFNQNGDREIAIKGRVLYSVRRED